MNLRPAVLLYPAAVAAIATALFYATRLERQPNALLRQIHDMIERDARSHAIYRQLKRQRRGLNKISDYLLPVPKGVEKPVS